MTWQQLIGAGPQFPILTITRSEFPRLPPSVPWAFVAPHEAQAQHNHDQSLKRLAERGGLSWVELDLIIRDQAWDGSVYRDPVENFAHEALSAIRVLRRLNEWRKTHASD